MVYHMHYEGRYINSVDEFNSKRRELASALKSDLFRYYLLRGKPSKFGVKGYNPLSCIHPESDDVVTDHIARELIIDALEKFDAIEKNKKWSENWQRQVEEGKPDAFTYVYKHYSGEVTKNIFIKIHVQTDCNLPLLIEGKTRINKCIAFHPSGQN